MPGTRDNEGDTQCETSRSLPSERNRQLQTIKVKIHPENTRGAPSPAGQRERVQVGCEE